MVLVKKGPFVRFFLLANIGQENVFCDILERKNVFLGHGFGQKGAIFPFFFFRQYWVGKCVL